MLSPRERQEIEAEFPRYPDRQALSLEALKVVQRHRGWVSDECVKAIAELLDMTPEALDAVATFYNLIFRRPVGRHVILVCDSVSCWIMGYEPLCKRLQERLTIGLGETTADNRFTLLPICCLGACDHAPTLMIDDDLHRDVDLTKIDEILEKYD
jgi:NADH-quinone oxidoreductase subunit E